MVNTETKNIQYSGNETSQPDIRIAPMLDWTDRHARYFMRLISPNVKLYTEMITSGAIQHGDSDRHLRYSDIEHPIALQLGGSSPEDLAQSVKIANTYKYDEINLNCGCPSDRVQSGAFGACLMKDPQRVAACISAMKNETDAPVTIKCRIGVDDFDSYDFLKSFIEITAKSGCSEFIIHARKAWLKGLSPKENREIPPLHYDRVSRLKDDFPEYRFILNGGIQSMDQITELSNNFDGLMIGREAYQNPYLLAQIENELFDNSNTMSREDIALKMIAYAKDQYSVHSTPIKSITRHILGLYQGEVGAKRWRQTLSQTHKYAPDYFDIIQEALDNVHSAQRKTCKAA